MAVSALSAARTLCELRNWELSNLEIQKILYLAHMFHLGRTNAPLINESFEAWDYGPVVPEVYADARAFGSERVTGAFYRVHAVRPDSEEYKTLQEAAEGTRGVRAGRLVAITHRDNGAWAKNYRQGMRRIKIPNRDIIDEYRMIESVSIDRKTRMG